MSRHLETLRRSVRRLAPRRSGRGIVLMYHRVADVGSDPWALCVAPDHFDEHLQVLREQFRVVPLAELPKAIRASGGAPPPVAITFDDGYADSLAAVKPMLERYDMPATVFVTAGHLGDEREFWWDELERVLLRPGTLPESLALFVDGRRLAWRLGGAAEYDEDAYRPHRRWTVYEKGDPTPRHTLFRELYSLLYELAPKRRNALLDQLLAWAGSGTPGRSSHRVLTHAELGELAAGSLVEIGAHTLTHPALDTLSPMEQWGEIRGSRILLEEIASRRVTSFAYPHGAFTRETRRLVRDAGFAFACSTRYGTASRVEDPLALPRVEVRDGDGDAFTRLFARLGI